MLGSIGTWRFDSAIPLPKDEADAYSLAALGLCAATATAAGGAAVFVLFGQQIAQIVGQPEMVPWLWSIPATSLVLGVSLILTQLSIRHRKYYRIATRSFFSMSITALVQLTAGLAGMLTGGLVLGLGAGQAASAVSLLPGSGLRSQDARSGMRFRNMAANALRYRRFPLILAPSSLINVLGTQLPVILIAYYYGPMTAGWFGLTQRVVALPVVLITTAAAQVYLGELAQAVRSRPSSVGPMFYRVSRGLLAPAMLFAVILIVLAPALFTLVFGPDWTTSGDFARALAISVACQLVAAPLGHTLTVMQRQTLQATWDSSRLLLTCGTLIAAATCGAPAITAVWLFSGASSVLYLLLWFACLKSTRPRRIRVMERSGPRA